MKSFDVPILIIIFNRPDKVRALIDVLSAIRPSRVFVAADGPRSGNQEDEKNCVASREVIKAIDWPCEIVTNFSHTNRGCKIGVSSAITWFFSNVDEGIILEDDCVPSPSFFPYCKELLALYRSDMRIMHISGTNTLHSKDISQPTASYRFSRIPSIWGWATWKRAWDMYDISMKDRMKLGNDDVSMKLFSQKKYLLFWIHLFNHIADKNIDTWDAQWQYSILVRNGIAISPNTNLIDNIGFDQNATHTKGNKPTIDKASLISTPLSHPSTVTVDINADATMMKSFYMRSIWKKIFSWLSIK